MTDINRKDLSNIPSRPKDGYNLLVDIKVRSDRKWERNIHTERK